MTPGYKAYFVFFVYPHIPASINWTGVGDRGLCVLATATMEHWSDSFLPNSFSVNYFYSRCIRRFPMPFSTTRIGLFGTRPIDMAEKTESNWFVMLRQKYCCGYFLFSPL